MSFLNNFYEKILNMAKKEQNLSETYSNLLKKSKTAYDPGVAPTEADIEAEKNMMKAESKEDMADAVSLKKVWYGDEEMKEGGGNEKGYLEGALKTLGAPLYSLVGGIEAATGTGTKKGIANIGANIEEEGTFGDLLRNSGMNNTAAMPIGFALDLFADPLNWATLGTTAFIPKTFAGGLAGARTGTGVLKGLKTGAKSGFLSGVEKAGRMVPGLQHRAYELGRNGLITGNYKKLSMSAVDARKEFEKLIGKSLIQKVEEKGMKTSFGEKLADKMSETEAGSMALKLGKYSPGDWIERELALGRSQTLEQATMASKNPMDVLLGKKSAKGMTEQLVDTDVLMKNPQIARANSDGDFAMRMINEVDKDEAFRKAMNEELESIKENLFKGNDKALTKLNALTGGEKEDFYKLFDSFKSEMKLYDKNVAKVLLSEKGRKTIRRYGEFIGLFKNAKIGGNFLTAGVNAVVGNLVMTGMIGVDILDTNFMSSMKKAATIVRGKDTSAANVLLNGEWGELLNSGGADVFEAVFGMNPRMLKQQGAYIDEVAKEIAETMNPKGGTMLEGLEDVKEAYRQTMGKRAAEASIKAAEDVAKKSRSAVEGYLEGGKPNTFMSTEMLRGPYADFVNKVEEMAIEGKPFAKAFHWYLTKPMEGYNKFDQTYKLGLALHLTENGISEQELMKLGKRVKINSSEITEVPGRNLFKLTPEIAMKISNEAYMNYLAMPGFVQIMRTLPVLGSPFFSFAYGMTSLAGKTLIDNPAFYNKIQFLLQEVSGRKSPLEKEQLEGKYYSWLDRPGMVKMPFFQDNPVYLNMENMIPYYTMNIFQPVERSYESKFGSEVANLIDSTPFLKTPEGQLMFDYLIQPMILDGERPKGSFNQPLWREDDNALEKFGRFAQSAAETMVPPLTGYAGEAIPSEIAKYAPSYRLRQLSYAKEGKTSLGIPSKIPASERASQVRKAMAGWPTYKINLQFNK